jgi:folate-dependent phosphoribosylglycinamide formyltransferase PurN
MNRPWITFFSQTGGEIGLLILDRKIKPDLIITNKQDLSNIDKTLQDALDDGCKIVQLPKVPSVEDYLTALQPYENPLITLHGYLRILPKEVCEKYEIYNLHPGLITEYPELKGKDPQQRAYEGKYPKAGCVIHRVIPEVDCGEIVKSYPIIIEGYTLPRVFNELKSVAFILWKDFFNTYDKR